MSVAKSFTAVGVSDEILVRHGEQFAYDVSGTFVATVQVQQFQHGGWTVLASATEAAGATLTIDAGTKPASRVRIQCVLFTSGTVVTTLIPVTSEAAVVLRDANGAVLLQSSEDGLAVPSGKVFTATSPVLTTPSLVQPSTLVQVYNGTGVSIAADKVVAILGFDVTTGKPKIVLADADVAAHDDLYVTTAAIADATAGTVTKRALSAANLNTNSATSAGDPVYASVTAGGFVHTAPTTAISRVHPIGWVVVKSATVGQIYWNTAPVRTVGTNELQAAAVVAATIAAAAVTKTKLAGGFSRVSVVVGEDETTTHQITVTGMAVGDEVVQVLVLTTAASIATLAVHAGTFTAAADKITPGTEVNNTNNQYLVFWNDLT